MWEPDVNLHDELTISESWNLAVAVLFQECPWNREMKKTLLEQPGFGKSEQVGLCTAAALNPKLSPRETGENHRKISSSRRNSRNMFYAIQQYWRRNRSGKLFLLSAIEDDKIY